MNLFARLVLPVSLSALVYRYYNNWGNITTKNIIHDDVEWLWGRVPNIQEAFTTSWPLAAVSMVMEPIINTLYHDNPAAKSVVRDWTKIPSSIASWYYGNELGHTHIKYDAGHFYGGIAKTLCKSTVISGVAFTHPGLAVGALEPVLSF